MGLFAGSSVEHPGVPPDTTTTVPVWQMPGPFGGDVCVDAGLPAGCFPVPCELGGILGPCLPTVTTTEVPTVPPIVVLPETGPVGLFPVLLVTAVAAVVGGVLRSWAK